MHSRSLPRVGLVAARMVSDLDTLDKVATSYVDAVVRAGGLPFILPNVPELLGEWLDRVDALVLVGGTQDVDPALYGAANERADGVDRAKDEYEIALVRGACERDMPLLGICRGMQIVNVAFGGTLVQHLPELPIRHLDYPRQGERVHEVRLDAGRLLPYGDYRVNSVHHQAVDRPGDALVVTGRAPDGTIESLEHASFPILGVQWHPECLPDDALSERIFSWLTDSARERTVS